MVQHHSAAFHSASSFHLNHSASVEADRHTDHTCSPRSGVSTNQAGLKPFNHGLREIVRTQDPDIYRTGREGQFLYEIPLKPGTYELHLCFAETLVSGDSLRSVCLSINGVTVSNSGR